MTSATIMMSATMPACNPSNDVSLYQPIDVNRYCQLICLS